MGQFSNPVATPPRTNEIEVPPRVSSCLEFEPKNLKKVYFSSPSVSIDSTHWKKCASSIIWRKYVSLSEVFMEKNTVYLITRMVSTGIVWRVILFVEIL